MRLRTSKSHGLQMQGFKFKKFQLLPLIERQGPPKAPKHPSSSLQRSDYIDMVRALRQVKFQIWLTSYKRGLREGRDFQSALEQLHQFATFRTAVPSRLCDCQNLSSCIYKLATI